MSKQSADPKIPGWKQAAKEAVIKGVNLKNHIQLFVLSVQGS